MEKSDVYSVLAGLCMGYFKDTPIDYLFPFLRRLKTEDIVTTTRKHNVTVCKKCGRDLVNEMVNMFCWKYQEDISGWKDGVCILCLNAGKYKDFISTPEGKELQEETHRHTREAEYYECTVNVAKALCVFKRFVNQITTKKQTIELLQFFSIFPAAIIPPQFVKLVAMLKKLCKKHKITRVPEEVAGNHNWWANEFEDSISYGARIINEILNLPVDEYTIDYSISTGVCVERGILNFYINKFADALL